MLELAYSNSNRLQSQFEVIGDHPRFAWFNSGPYLTYELEIHKDNDMSLQYCSVSDDYSADVIGYFQCDVDRFNLVIENLNIIRFTDEPNYEFSKDLSKFLRMIYELKPFRKITWSVIVGNPAEKMYDKIIKKYNGRVVGVFKDERLVNNEYHDEKFYEILK